MWMVWLLWITIVAGGFFMGIGSALALRRGFDLALALNAVLYTGCALYGLPKLLRLGRPAR
jgi:hypothetical protein